MSITARGDVRVTTLANGLRVATDAMPQVETATLGLWVNVGTRDERPELAGVSHLLEHMAFKGTGRRSARAITEEIEAVGGHLNAYTARESTAYYAKVLAQHVPLAVDILSDILLHSTFDDAELSRERAVVLQEIGQVHDTPDDVVFDHFQAAAFPAQPLGRPVLGDAEVVRTMPRDVLVGYLEHHYRAGDMVLAAAGKVEHDALVALAEAAFGDVPAGPGADHSGASYRGGAFREARALEQVHLVLGFRGVPYKDPDYYALGVLANLMGGGMSSRLFQELREARGLVYSIYAFATSYADDGLFGVYAGTGAEQIAELMPVLCDEIAAAATAAPDGDEFDRACTQLWAGLLMSLESSGARCEQLAHQLLVHGRPLSVAEQLDDLAAVDGAAVRRVAERLLASPPTLAAMGPVEHLAADATIAARLRALAA